MAPSLEEMMRHRRSPRRALLPSTALSQRQKMNLTPTASLRAQSDGRDLSFG